MTHTIAVPFNKTYLFYFLVVFGLTFNVNGQNTEHKLSVSFDAQSLREVIQYLKEHQAQQFSYSKEQIPWEAKVTLHASGSLKEILTLICEQAGLEYEQIADQIVLRKKASSGISTLGLRDFAEVFGTVLDSASGTPLPFANVFFDNSSFGSTTDNLGRFTLNNVPIEFSQLIASYVGYKTLLTHVNLEANGKVQLVIKLQPEARQLQDVVVVEKRDTKWLQDFEQFKTEILGHTANARLCTIQNPNAVRLRRSFNTLFADTSEPLEIDNKALGYHEKILIEKFVSGGDSCSFVFYSQFDTMSTSDERERFRWELNRLNAYSGSQIHLFRSLLRHRVEAEGFEIFEWKGSQVQTSYNGQYVAVPKFLQLDMDSTPMPSGTAKSISVLNAGKYLVRYKLSLAPGGGDIENRYPTSIIRIRTKSMFVNANGTPLLYDNYVQTGYFEAQRLADKLPNDYDDVKSKAKVAEYQSKRVGEIEVVVIDSVSHKPLPSVTVFINQSSIHYQSDDHGRVIFRSIPLGHQDIVFYKAGFHLVQRYIQASILHRGDTIKLTRLQFSELEDVAQEARELYMSEFQKALFSGNFDTRRMTNAGVVNITNAGQDSVTLWSLSPIEIIDKRLDYKINMFLDHCKLVHERATFKDIALRSYCFFEDLRANRPDPNVEAKRLAQYDGSLLNFSRSLLDGRIAEEGFALYPVDESEGYNHRAKKRKRSNENPLSAGSIAVKKNLAGISVQLPPAVEIHFIDASSGKIRISNLAVRNPNIEITDFGMIQPRGGWQVKGHMNEKGLLPKLPINFKPLRGVLLNPF